MLNYENLASVLQELQEIEDEAVQFMEQYSTQN